MAIVTPFSDEEFEKALRESENPDLMGYELFVDTHGTKIHRHYIESSGLYAYKSCGVLADLEAEVCAHVFVDSLYRKKWDKYMLDAHIIEEDDTLGHYWLVDYPWPLSDRDFTFVRDMKLMDVNGVKTWVVLARYREFAGYPPNSGVSRVNEYQQSCVMQPHERGTKVYMYHYFNPGGLLPTWLINWVAKVGLPAFMENMRKSILGYKDYLEELKKESGNFDNEERLRELYRLSL